MEKYVVVDPERGALEATAMYVGHRGKTFCDEGLLENQIPDTFHQSATLNKLHIQLVTKVIRIPSGVPS